MKLIDLLVEVPGDEKRAGMESPNKQQLEQDFSRLAYAFLKDRAPDMLPYLLGFEIVDQEEDGSKAVGLFGFKVGDKFYYVPTFFMNNQIKGIDLLYSKDDNQFLPLREGWINNIINKQSISLGKSYKSENPAQDAYTTPNFTFMNIPPSGGPLHSFKWGSALTGITDVWNQMQQEIVGMLEKDAEFQYMFANAIHAMKNEPFEKHASARLPRYLEQRGGPVAAQMLANQIHRDWEFAKAASKFYDIKDLLVAEFSKALEPKTAESKITVVTGVHEWNSADHKDTQRIIRDGFTIKDTRTESEKSEIAKGDYRQTISNPDVAGRYNMIMSEFGDKDVHVLKAEAGPKGMLVVIDPQTRKYFTAGSTAVYVSSQPLEQDNKVWEAAVSLDQMEPFAKYVLVNEKFECSVPFKVESVISVDGDTAKIKVRWYDGIDHEGRKTPSSLGGCEPFSFCNDNIIPVSGGGRLRKIEDSILVPKNAWKAYRLETADESNETGAMREAKQQAFQPASYGEVLETMTKAGLHNLVVESRDGGVAYGITLNDVRDGQPVTYKTAAVKLVRDYGLGYDDVEEILKDACDNFKARRVVKFAQQVMMPPPAMYSEGTDPTTGIPIDPFREQLIRGKTTGVPKPMRAGPGSGINFGGEGAMQAEQAEGAGGPEQPDQDAMMLAQQAAQTGQGTVFDQSVIGGMAKTYDVSGVIDSYMPDFMKSLDKLGRMIFMFYWKNDDFADRYGNEDLSGMEDQLRGVYKNFGDLILDLRRKTIEPDAAVQA